MVAGEPGGKIMVKWGGHLGWTEEGQLENRTEAMKQQSQRRMGKSFVGLENYSCKRNVNKRMESGEKKFRTQGQGLMFLVPQLRSDVTGPSAKV